MQITVPLLYYGLMMRGSGDRQAEETSCRGLPQTILETASLQPPPAMPPSSMHQQAAQQQAVTAPSSACRLPREQCVNDVVRHDVVGVQRGAGRIEAGDREARGQARARGRRVQPVRLDLGPVLGRAEPRHQLVLQQLAVVEEPARARARQTHALPTS